ncbi:MAG TPA: hypothetical protein VHI13_19060 [Candidatus Kapabacteria bacterium]|nr:hypothetical protein [Candidatus Kapabacteria bacterium]
MDPSAPYITASAALLGVIIGSLLTGFLKWIEERHNRRRALNQALHSLLEIRQTLRRFDATKNVHAVGEVIAEKAGIPIEELSTPMDQAAPMVQLAHAAAWDETLSDRFRETANAVAAFDPLLAYELHGGAVLQLLAQYIPTYNKQVLYMLNRSRPDERAAYEKYRHIPEDFIRNEAIRTIEGDARMIAKRISKRRAGEIEQKLAENYEEEKRKDDERYLDFLIERGILSVQVQPQAGTDGASS